LFAENRLKIYAKFAGENISVQHDTWRIYRGVTNSWDSLMLHGMTDFSKKVGSVKKALVIAQMSVDSRKRWPIDIVRRIAVEIA
jgi:hypothetical protein